MKNFKEFIKEISDKTLNTYKQKSAKSIEKSSKKQDSNIEKANQAHKNSLNWYNRAINAKYHSSRESGGRVYPEHTYVGATSRANSEGVKSVKHSKKADELGKLISKRLKGLDLANKRLNK